MPTAFTRGLLWVASVVSLTALTLMRRGVFELTWLLSYSQISEVSLILTLAGKNKQRSCSCQKPSNSGLMISRNIGWGMEAQTNILRRELA